MSMNRKINVEVDADAAELHSCATIIPVSCCDELTILFWNALIIVVAFMDVVKCML